MKTKNLRQTRLLYVFTGLLFFILSVLPLKQVSAQVSDATFNIYEPLVENGAKFDDLSVTSSQIGVWPLIADQFANKSRVIDANLTNSSAWTFVAAGSAWLEVKDNKATGADVYPAGTYAGFMIADAG